jgi:hypothetical protein
MHGINFLGVIFLISYDVFSLLPASFRFSFSLFLFVVQFSCHACTFPPLYSIKISSDMPLSQNKVLPHIQIKLTQLCLASASS